MVVFILLYVTAQFSQHHLLKSLSSLHHMFCAPCKLIAHICMDLFWAFIMPSSWSNVVNELLFWAFTLCQLLRSHNKLVKLLLDCSSFTEKELKHPELQ